jgi:hypothetical protein
MPSKKAELDARMKKETGFAAQFLPHYVRAKAMRGEIEHRVAQFRTAAFADEAIARARAFLPASVTAEQPSVAFVVFAPDSRGYDPVVLDILWVIQQVHGRDHRRHAWQRRAGPHGVQPVRLLPAVQRGGAEEGRRRAGVLEGDDRLHPFVRETLRAVTGAP